VTLRQVIEIVCLEQHIIKFNEIEAGFQADLVAFGGKHPVNTEVPAYITQKLDVAKIDQPIGIVEEHRSIIAEIEEPRELLFECGNIEINLCQRQKLPHFGLAARVSHKTRSSPYKNYGAMALALHVCKGHNGNEAANVQAVCGRVEPYVARRGFGQIPFQFVNVCGLRHKAALRQNVEDIWHLRVPL
jgi:hypothetical protein